MINNDRPFVLEPIGVVRSPLKNRAQAPHQGRENMIKATIEIYGPFRAHLDDLAAHKQLWVISWLDRAERDILRVHPRGDPERPLTHVWATRSPGRPNPLGLCLVDLLGVDAERGTLEVAGLDALNGTPVVDIKPYSPRVDKPQ
jgi:tRNA-Thr(GGU) m(6)t(6)A37 methyltransferase TsaA